MYRNVYDIDTIAIGLLAVMRLAVAISACNLLGSYVIVFVGSERRGTERSSRSCSLWLH